MDMLMYTILAILATPLFLALLLKIYTSKSINDPNYPPVNGTVFHQLFYFTRLYDCQTEASKKHPTFRLLAPSHSEIYTTDSRNIEHVLKTKFSKYSKGKYNQDIITDLFGEGIFAVDDDKWRHQRKLASFEFSTRILRDFSSSIFRQNAAKLVKIVSEFSHSKQVMDIQELLMKFTLDSIFKVGFGVELNSMEGASEESSAFSKAFDDSNALVYWRYCDPFWKLKRYFNIGSEATLKKNIEIIDHFVYQLINTKKKQLQSQRDNNEKEDILSRFLVESEKDIEKMNDKYMRDVILNFMIAGKDTTAVALSWFLYMLCENPSVQDKIVQEIINNGLGGDAFARVEDFVEQINEGLLEKMHYLHAALSETLRLYPAVPVDGRCAEEDDVLPDGHILKKGDGVYYLAYSMGRLPHIWGHDALDFRPERWLDNGIFRPESPFKFVAFHGGPRICLGKDFAYRQMKIVSISLLNYFKFKLADETKNVTYRTMFTLHIKDGLSLNAETR